MDDPEQPAKPIEQKSPEQIVPPPIPSRSHSRTFYIILVILGVILLSSMFTLVVYLIGARTNLNQQKQTSNLSKVISPTPKIYTATSPAPNGAGANWKTYVDSSKRFSFKYPSEWEQKKKPPLHPSQGYGPGTNFGPINSQTNCGFTLLGPIQTISSIPLEDTYKLAGGILLSREQINIDNHKGIKQIYLIKTNNTWNYEAFFLDPTISITRDFRGTSTPILAEILALAPSPTQKDMQCSKIYDQILSTFKFLP